MVRLDVEEKGFHDCFNFQQVVLAVFLASFCPYAGQPDLACQLIHEGFS